MPTSSIKEDVRAAEDAQREAWMLMEDEVRSSRNVFTDVTAYPDKFLGMGMVLHSGAEWGRA